MNGSTALYLLFMQPQTTSKEPKQMRHATKSLFGNAYVYSVNSLNYIAYGFGGCLQPDMKGNEGWRKYELQQPSKENLARLQILFFNRHSSPGVTDHRDLSFQNSFFTGLSLQEWTPPYPSAQEDRPLDRFTGSHVEPINPKIIEQPCTLIQVKLP